MTTIRYRRETSPMWQVIVIWSVAGGVIATGTAMVWIYNLWR